MGIRLWTLVLCLASLASLSPPAKAESATEEVKAPEVKATDRLGALGVKPLDSDALTKRRGKAEVINDMRLKGVVGNNQAINVQTGGNLITEGALAGSAGIPTVIQNSGNNVLIQNATILNLQLK